MNKVILIGRLVKKPELRYTQNNKAVATFTLAVNRNYTNEDGKVDADFINCIVWGKAGENCNKYLDKGSQVAIIGELHNRNYEDKNGQKRQTTEIIAESVQFLESKKQDVKEEQKQADPFQEFADEISEQDLPF